MNIGRVEKVSHDGEVRTVYDAAEARGESKESQPVIVLEPGHLPEIVDRAEELLVSHTEALEVFQRAGEVVRAVALQETSRASGVQRPAGSMVLVPVTQLALSEILGRIAKWERRGEGGNHRVDCPPRISATYLSRIGQWKLPMLRGIIFSPILRPDGSILSRRGYDAETGLFLVSDALIAVPESPTREDALAALGNLRKPFSQFPFTGAGESVFFSAILTAIQRRLLPTAPLFCFTAPAARSGKSLLADCVSIIATGRPAPAAGVSSEREEVRKSVASILRQGDAIALLDNIEGVFGSPDLCRAVTQAEFSERVLGETRQLRLPTNVVWVATGNNLTLRGDLTVRALLCRIDPCMERPEERVFLIPNLREHLAENRSQLVQDALTILRAYHLAGQPEQSATPWGGFEIWCRTIRDPLLWLGMPDPCGTRTAIAAEDPDREAALNILNEWHRVLGADLVNVSAVVEAAQSEQELLRALLFVASASGDDRRIDPRRLGKWCSKWRDRVLSGFVLSRCGEQRGVAKWRVSAPGKDAGDRKQTHETLTPTSHEAESRGNGGLVGVFPAHKSLPGCPAEPVELDTFPGREAGDDAESF